MKIISSTIRGCKLQVPIDGLISVDARGIANVSDKCARLLTSRTRDWSYYKEETKQEPESTPITDSGDDKVINGIKIMTVDELIGLAQESGYPEDEWRKFTTRKTAQKLLATYMIKKYNDAKNVQL